MQYDIAGNQNQLVDPSAGTITYTYNGFGELTDQQNARGQTTYITYYADGRPDQKTLSLEGTTTYNYNTNKQLTGISSPGGVNRSFGYDTKGMVNSITDTIPGTPAFITSFTYDKKGRDSTITHPSGIVEKNIYNSNGYLSSISAGGSTRWTVTGMNARQQITSGTYGSDLSATFGYNNYGYPISTVTGTIQNYQYDFYSYSGNLNWRKNVLQANIQENFEYDNLDRLDRVYFGMITKLDMAYTSGKGGISTKTDVGTLNYNSANKPYALTSINPSAGLITSAMDDSLTYTSFESIKTITEGTYNATFTYNSDNERAKMVVLNGTNLILNRWYPNSSFIKDSTSGASKTYTFIGGDAYTATVMAIKINNGTPAYYYLLRDYLGSITHVVNTSKTVVAEYSYDAWGRMRNPATWVCYAPGQEPDLTYAGRGFTGHEHLPWFKLINMNGRVYDPLTGQFLSPDNFVQTPDFTQSYNRYSYALNNPLIYTDPDGEWFQWIIGGVLGGIFNVYENRGNIDSFKDWFVYYNIGNLAGSTGSFAGELIGKGLGKLGIEGGTFGGAAIGGTTGFIGGFLQETLNSAYGGKSLGDAVDDGWSAGKRGAAWGAAIGGLTGGWDAYRDGRNVWWGTEPINWAYNRNQWSLAWWDKPDKIVFEDVKNLGAGQINCMAKSFQDMYGNTEQYWDTYTNNGRDVYTLQHIRSGGGQAMMYPGSDPIVSYTDISRLNQSGGRAMIAVENYRNLGAGHAMAVKKVLSYPGGRLNAILFDPYNGSRLIMRNFTQGTTFGTNLRFWFIHL